MLDPDRIKEAFPFGAKEWKKRWLPCPEGEEPARSLRRLLKDKRDTIPKRRLMHRDSSRGYTDNPAQAIRVRPDSGEAISKEDQKLITAEAHERDQARADGRPLWEMLRELEDGLSERQKQSIRRRVEAARRAKAA